MKLLAAAILALALASPVAAAKPVKPFVFVSDTHTEVGWERYPFDSTYGEGFRVGYSGGTQARFHCHDESGVDLTTETRTLVGENPGESPSIWLTYPYAAATYAFCTAELLGKRGRVVARDNFTIYAPV